MASYDNGRFDELITKLENRQPHVSTEQFENIKCQTLQNETENVKKLVNDYFSISRDPKRRYEGHRFNKKYELGEVIGEGATGIVHEAKEISKIFNKRPVAIKIINPGIASNKKKDLFIEEVRTYLELDESAARYNILPIREADIYIDPKTKEKIPFCVMLLVEEAKSLTAYVKEKEDINDFTKLKVFVQICEAVQYAHSNDIFHGDLKPSNILINKKGRPWVIDFGLAYAHNILKSKSHFGTPEYMSPEQFSDYFGKPGKQSDIYTLGVILFELLGGEKPYDLPKTEDSDYFEKICEIILKSQPTKLRAVNKNCHKKLDKIVSKALEKNPSARHKTVKDLKDAVSEVMTVLSPNYRFIRVTSPKSFATILGVSILIQILSSAVESEALRIDGLYYFIRLSTILVAFWLLLTLNFKYVKPIRPMFNSTLRFSYIVGVAASIIGGLIYAFGPPAKTELVTEIQPMWNIKFLRFMIPGAVLPFFYASIFAISTARRSEKSFKSIVLSVFAWLFLAVTLVATVYVSIHLIKYASEYSNISLLLGDKRQGDVRCEIFLLISFLSVLLVINYENWKLVKNINSGSLLFISGASFCSRLVASFVFLTFSGCVLAISFWGKGLTPVGKGASLAIILIGLFSGWSIGSFYLFTGKQGLVKWIDQNYIAKRAQQWSWSTRIEEAREKWKDKWFSH